MKKYSGVTLLELLIGLVVAGILVALAAPGFRSLLVRRQMEAAVDALLGDFRLARSEAIKRGHSVTICRSISGQACESRAGGWEVGWIVFDDKDGSNTVNAQADERVLRWQQPLAGVSTITATGGGNATAGVAYEFRANGLATGTMGSLTVTPAAGPASSIRVLCVSSLGRLSARAPGATTC